VWKKWSGCSQAPGQIGRQTAKILQIEGRDAIGVRLSRAFNQKGIVNLAATKFSSSL
jgi:hypothetical protein